MGLREIKTDENRSAEGELSAERLRELLDYDPQTGEFAWKPQKAGTLTSDGYIQICVDGKRYRAQRLAVLHMTGEWPKDVVDHKNRVRSDNRWGNLEDSNPSKNAMNSGVFSTNTSGVRGVCWHRRTGKWHAKIDVRGKRVHLGYFDTLEEATAARQDAEERFHGPS